MIYIAIKRYIGVDSMKKKLITIISCLLAAVFGLGMFSGCELLETDNRRDMEQVVAEVNIGADVSSLNDMFATIFGSEYSLDADVSGALDDIVTTESISKRDLVAYFINYAYNYVSSQNMTYAQAFEQSVSDLVSRKIMVQYAMLYYLSEGEVVVDRDSLSTEVLNNLEDYGYEVVAGTDGIRVKSGLSVSGYLSVKNAEGLSGDAQTLAMLGYFMTDAEKNYAEYQVRLTINNAIDSYEESIISSESSDSSSSDSDRAAPTGANETDSNYYPQKDDKSLNYEVYTGSNYDADLGDYERLDGSTPITRRKAYNSFINSLNRNYLKDDSENPSDIYSLNYYTVELKAQYEQMMINKFADTLSLNMSNNEEQSNLESLYNLMLQTQTSSANSGTSSSFTTTMDSVSDSSFVLYSPSAGYGFVYNVLLPFNTMQSAYLSAIQSKSTTAEYYAERSKMAENILGEDQRSTWFNGAEDYSFDADEEGVDYYGKDGSALSSYLFFKDSYTKSGDGIDRYAGKYPYHGEVTPESDGTYTLVPEKISVKDFLNEFDGYLSYLDEDLSLTGSYDENFYTYGADDYISSSANFEYDYSKMVYYKGQVNGLEGTTAADLLEKGSASYTALSAFNDLMFAYSTDTGCLNTYLGYSIAAKGYSTTYVAEFEYAAQEALQDALTNGYPGRVYVVLTDYGWHVIYVSMVLKAGNVYENGFVYGERNTEGTFSYYFYQTLKSQVADSYTSDIQNRVIELLNNDSNVKTYPSRYADLASISA